MKRELLAALCLVGVPLAVNAQGCIGTPTQDGQYAIAGNLGIASGAKSYGVEVNRDMIGPLTIGAAYTMTDFDNTSTNGNSFGAGAAFQLDMPTASMCPTARIVYNRVHESTFGGAEATVNQVVIPIGFGIGKSFPASPGFNFTLFAEPQFLYIHSSVDAATGLGNFSASGSNNELGANLGMRFAGASFYAGASMSLTTIDNSDPVFGVTIGALVGKR